MVLRPLCLSIPLLLLACDQPTEEELRSMMSEVAQAEVASVKGDQEELQQKVEAVEQAQTKLQTQFADVQAQAVALEVQLADAQSRIDALEKANEDAKPPPTPGRPDPEATYKVEIGDAQVDGPADALVTIVTWSDFQCPYCKRVTDTIDQVQSAYGKDVRYVFKHNPLGFHPNARPAAIAAEAAGEQGKFWEMHDKLFENARDLSEKNFKKWARELKLDVKQFERDLESPTIAARIDRQQQQGMDLGARGTPAFFINGRFLSGAQPLPNFKKLIDEEMAKARTKVAAGTPRSEVYAETIRGGKTEP